MTTCPYLVPVVADRLWLMPQTAFCRRPDARVRAPAAITLGGLCTSDRFTDCAGYRRTVERTGCEEERP